MYDVVAVHKGNSLKDLEENIGYLVVAEIPPILRMKFFIEGDEITGQVLKH